MGEILANTSLPKDSFSILPCHLTEAHHFSENPKIRLISFTGSAKVSHLLLFVFLLTLDWLDVEGKVRENARGSFIARRDSSYCSLWNLEETQRVSLTKELTSITWRSAWRGVRFTAMVALMALLSCRDT